MVYEGYRDFKGKYRFCVERGAVIFEGFIDLEE